MTLSTPSRSALFAKLKARVVKECPFMNARETSAGRRGAQGKKDAGARLAEARRCHPFGFLEMDGNQA